MNLVGYRYNYFYVEHPEDFEAIISPLKIINNEPYTIEGTLYKLCKNTSAKGLILIDWTKFTVKQIATYKSVLDEYPTIKGLAIPYGIKIINTALVGTKACSSFHSRTQKIYWPSRHVMNKTAHDIHFKYLSETVSDAIDLEESKDWADILIGKNKMSQKGFVYQNGALINAIIAQEKSLTITGTPDNDGFFKEFLDRIKRENGFYANGDWYSLPKGFTFIFSVKPARSRAEFKNYIPDIETGKNQNVFYINKQNFYCLFELMHITDQYELKSMPALLNQMQDGSRLILTEQLSPSDIEKLEKEIDILRSSSNPKRIYLEVLPYLNDTKEVNSPITKSVFPEHLTSSESYLVLTDDIEAVARLCTDAKKEEIHISKLTQFSQLFADVTKLSNDANSCQGFFGKRSLKFEYHTFKLFEKLKAGETIILKGEISNELFHQLETLFSNPSYLIINGKAEIISGKLILITHPKEDFPHLFDSAVNRYEHKFDWENIPQYLFSKIDDLDVENAKKLAQQIKSFLDEVQKIKHNGKTTPPVLIINQDSVLRIAQAMRHYSDKINPIEQTFLQSYTEDKLTYKRIAELATNHLSQVKEEKTELMPQHKQQKTLVEKILKHSPFIELRGTPGTGKSHFIEHHFSKENSFLGENSIIGWLESSRDDTTSIKYLLLDEANMKEPGYWDFLKGLSTKRIYYKDKFYDVDPTLQKVVFTGNPENYPGRYFHTFLQEVPKVNFKSHTDEYLHDSIIFPQLKQYTSLSDETCNQISRMFIHAYKIAKDLLPYETINIRDIKSLITHFCFPNAPDENEAQSYAHLVCAEVFSGLFKNKTSRDNYCQILSDNFIGCEKASFKPLYQTNDFYLPSSRQLFWNNVSKCISRGGLLPTGARRALLVEGESGIGKTKIMIEALKSQGFTSLSENSNYLPPDSKIYIHFSMGTSNISQKIREARDLSINHSVVIVMDELNLLTREDEILLTSLLEGKNPEAAVDGKYNLVILASQNSQCDLGRPPLSQALLNRFDCMYEDSYSREDLYEICRKSNAFSLDNNDDRIKKFVDRFLIKQSFDPESINLRKFFNALRALNEKNATNLLSKFHFCCSEPKVNSKRPKLNTTLVTDNSVKNMD